MIPGDEGKPMSILEFISDVPCDPEPFVDYLIEDYKARLKYWAESGTNWGQPTDPFSPTRQELVCHWMTGFLINLEEIKRKMHRPSRETVLARQTEPK